MRLATQRVTRNASRWGVLRFLVKMMRTLAPAPSHKRMEDGSTSNSDDCLNYSVLMQVKELLVNMGNCIDTATCVSLASKNFLNTFLAGTFQGTQDNDHRRFIKPPVTCEHRRRQTRIRGPPLVALSFNQCNTLLPCKSL